MTRPVMSRTRVRITPTACTTERGFAHHWTLGEPNERKVTGACSYCGAIREWPASIAGVEFNLELARDSLIPRTPLNFWLGM